MNEMWNDTFSQLVCVVARLTGLDANQYAHDKLICAFLAREGVGAELQALCDKVERAVLKEKAE